MDSSLHKKYPINQFLKYGIITLLVTIPFSFEWPLGTSRINLPSELIIVLLSFLLITCLKIRPLFESTFIRHRLTIIALVYHFWMVLMVSFSINPTASAKYVLVNLSHFWLSFFGFYYFKTQALGNIKTWLFSYGTALLFIVFYSWYQFNKYDFRIDASLLASKPFYFDHAIYSVCLAMVLPFYFLKDEKGVLKKFDLALACVFIIAVFLSYSRATWMAAFLALVFVLAISFFNKKWFIGLVTSFGLILFCLIFSPLIMNKQSSFTSSESKKSSLIDHVKSIGNTSTDVSNLERINRYKCAFRMAKEKPITGFGPGVYAEAYLPFQKPEEMTRLSVTSTLAANGKIHPSGRGGGAHSEYLQNLSELGWPGFLVWSSMVIYSIAIGIRSYYKGMNDRLSLACIFALLCYYIHGIFNNFLHSEELSFLFWPIIATLVMEDLKSSKSV